MEIQQFVGKAGE